LKFVVVLLTVAIVAAADDCDYVINNVGVPLDNTKVKNCFNSYKVPMDFVNAILNEIDYMGKVYPYVDIAKNPPENMRSFFDPVDFEQEFKSLKTTLEVSEGIASKVFRPVANFFGKYHDGHTHITFANTDYSKNIFAGVLYAFPFEWYPVVDTEGKTRVKLLFRTHSALMGEDFVNTLDEKTADLYADTIDGKEAFDYLKTFHNDASLMKSLQSILYKARETGVTFLSQPLDDEDFEEHTIVFSDGTVLPFTIIIVNIGAQQLNAQYSLAGPSVIPYDVWKKAEQTKQKRYTCRRTDYVQCYNETDDFNFIHVGSFGLADVPNSDLVSEIKCFAKEVADCIKSFDTNDAPIIVSLLGNDGGLEYVSRLMSELLFPDYGHPLVKAYRQTDETEVFKNTMFSYGTISFATDTCEPITYSSVDSYLKRTVTDDLGNSVEHKRTPKFYCEYDFLEYVDYAITKYPRKPTDIVVLTDSFCASACSMFVNSVLDNGEAIVAGIGTPYDSEQKFTASQIQANNVERLFDLFGSLKDESEKYGIKIGVTFAEHYPLSKKLDEVIPREFVLNKIDVNIPDSEDGNPVLAFPYKEYLSENFGKIVSDSLDVIETFTDSCNPDNKHLLLLSDKCEITDDNVLKMGYACGSDGHWNKNECKIAVCKSGFVDFDTNTCLTPVCDDSSVASGSTRLMVSAISLLLAAFISLLF